MATFQTQPSPDHQQCNSMRAKFIVKKCWCTWVTLIPLFFFFFFHVIWSMLLTHKSLKRQIYPRALEHLGGKEYTGEMLEKAQWSYFWPPRVWTPLLCTTRSPQPAQSSSRGQSLRWAHSTQHRWVYLVGTLVQADFRNVSMQLAEKKNEPALSLIIST